jgi:hypothetical protein
LPAFTIGKSISVWAAVLMYAICASVYLMQPDRGPPAKLVEQLPQVAYAMREVSLANVPFVVNEAASTRAMTTPD